MTDRTEAHEAYMISALRDA